METDEQNISDVIEPKSGIKYLYGMSKAAVEIPLGIADLISRTINGIPIQLYESMRLGDTTGWESSKAYIAGKMTAVTAYAGICALLMHQLGK
ncbi:hypothetical protein KY366_03980 [Candidatus Woesearchaeota archaeon]|nr:hypothetical protein [Candidatus Woesearchaeota archaeon]